MLVGVLWSLIARAGLRTESRLALLHSSNTSPFSTRDCTIGGPRALGRHRDDVAVLELGRGPREAHSGNHCNASKQQSSAAGFRSVSGSPRMSVQADLRAEGMSAAGTEERIVQQPATPKAMRDRRPESVVGLLRCRRFAGEDEIRLCIPRRLRPGNHDQGVALRTVDGRLGVASRGTEFLGTSRASKDGHAPAFGPRSWCSREFVVGGRVPRPHDSLVRLGHCHASLHDGYNREHTRPNCREQF
jgi:hypothetical protein